MGFLKDNKEKRELYNKKIDLESKFKEKYKTEKKCNKNKVSQDTKLAKIVFNIAAEYQF